jgi:hypothetical protein
VTSRGEAMDLAELADKLERKFAVAPPTGYLVGRTVLRDAIAEDLMCSQLQAEELVDTMIERGFLHYEGTATEDVDDLYPWRIQADPSA